MVSAPLRGSPPCQRRRRSTPWRPGRCSLAHSQTHLRWMSEASPRTSERRGRTAGPPPRPHTPSPCQLNYQPVHLSNQSSHRTAAAAAALDGDFKLNVPRLRRCSLWLKLTGSWCKALAHGRSTGVALATPRRRLGSPGKDAESLPPLKHVCGTRNSADHHKCFRLLRELLKVVWRGTTELESTCLTASGGGAPWPRMRRPHGEARVRMRAPAASPRQPPRQGRPTASS